MDNCNDIEKLISKNKTRAYLSLVGLLAVFVFSIMLFFYSGALSNSEEPDKFNEYFNTLKKELDYLDDQRSEYRDILSQIEKQLQSNVESGINQEAGKIKDDYDRFLLRLKELEPRYERLSTEVKELEKIQIDRLKAETSVSTDKIVSVAITRIGAVGLSVFMIQILLSFYRYFQRIVNHYESKLVTIKAISDESEFKSEILKSLSTEHITFGKEPQLPYEKLIELFKVAK